MPAFASLYVHAWYAWTTNTSSRIDLALVQAMAEASNWTGFVRVTRSEIATKAAISAYAARTALLQLDEQGFIAVCIPAADPDKESIYRLDLAPPEFVAACRGSLPAVMHRPPQ
jgi:hypothetical protein